jgi:hypothetical protein
VKKYENWSVSDWEKSNYSFHDLTPEGTIIPWNLKITIGLGLKFCPTPPSLAMKDYGEAFDKTARGIILAFHFEDFSGKYFGRDQYPSIWFDGIRWRWKRSGDNRILDPQVVQM